MNIIDIVELFEDEPSYNMNWHTNRLVNNKLSLTSANSSYNLALLRWRKRNNNNTVRLLALLTKDFSRLRERAVVFRDT